MKNFMILTATVVFIGIFTTLNEAASISSNIEGAMVCPGEELILTCVGQGTSQRWIITDEDGANTEVSFSTTSDEQTLVSRIFNTMTFEFVLMSVAFDHFESTVSVVVTEEINNTRVECVGRLSRDSVVVMITGVPSSPRGLMGRVLEYGSEYLTAEMIWEPPNLGNDSRIDFYHCQVLDGLSEENASVVLDLNTTNTTVMVIIHINTSAALLQFVLSACNCNGASTPVAVVISIFNESDQFETKTMHTISSRPSLGLVTEIQEFQNNRNILLTSISSMCGAIVFVMLITCLILSLCFLKLLKNKDREFSDDVIPEAEMDTLKADLSLSSADKNDTYYSEPVFENIKCEASVEDFKEDIPKESCLH